MLNKKLSIIIVNYQSANFLKKCVDSVCEKFGSKIPFEIILVNNDEKELNKEIIDNPKVKIINNYKNIGFGAGNNIGAKIAQGEILFFLNPDTEIISLAAEEIFPLFENNEKTSVIGSQLLSVDGKTQQWSAGYGMNLLDLMRNNLGWPSSQKFLYQKELIKVEWVSAAALFIKKETFFKVGGFDENFFMYFEDMDLCKRIRNAGKEVLYCPNFSIKHYGGESYQNKKMQKRDYYNSQKYYFKKHRNFFEWLAIKIASKLFYNV